MNQINTGPSSEEIISALRQTGFILEQDVRKVLEKQSIYCEVSRAYEDPDEGKSREVDVWGYKEFFRAQHGRSIFAIQLVIECKNPKQPYVIVGRAAQDRDRNRVPFGAKFYCDEGLRVPLPPVPPSIASNRFVYRPIWHILDLSSANGSPSADPFVGNQLVVMERKKEWIADNDHMFNGIVMPMAKAVTSVSKRRVAHGKFNPETDFAVNQITLPILVTSNDIFEVDTGSDTLEAIKRPWSNVVRHIKTDKLDLHVRVDVVQAQHLEDFLRERVLSFGEDIARRVGTCPEILTVTDLGDLPDGVDVRHLSITHT